MMMPLSATRAFFQRMSAGITGLFQEPARAPALNWVQVSPPGTVKNSTFMQWLRDGLLTDQILLNQPGAYAHVVPEGLLLVSPWIFQRFDARGWRCVQRSFLRLEIHRIGPGNSNFWVYLVDRGRRGSSLLKGVLVERPEQLLNIELPAVNPRLSLLGIAPLYGVRR